MEEIKQLYKSFENKPCFVLTNSNFKFNTKKLIVLENGVSFTDNRGNKILISFSEIKLIQEVKNGN